LTWTARDVGGPGVGTFGRIHELAHLPHCKAANSKKPLRRQTENRWHQPCCRLPFPLMLSGSLTFGILDSLLQGSSQRGTVLRRQRNLQQIRIGVARVS